MKYPSLRIQTEVGMRHDFDRVYTRAYQRGININSTFDYIREMSGYPKNSELPSVVKVKVGSGILIKRYNPLTFTPNPSLRTLKLLALDFDCVSFTTEIDYCGLNFIEKLTLIGPFDKLESLCLPTNLRSLHLQADKPQGWGNLKSVQFPVISNCDQLHNFKNLKLLAFESKVVSQFVKNLPVSIENFVIIIRAHHSDIRSGTIWENLSFSDFNVKRLTNIYTFQLSVACKEIDLFELPKNVRFLELNFGVPKDFARVTSCLFQIPDVNLPVEKRGARASLITRYATEYLDLSLLNFDRFLAILIKRPGCFANRTVIKLVDVSSTLNSFILEKCYESECDANHNHFSLNIPKITCNMPRCGMLQYGEAMKFEGN
ncbi:unnamed protein product [Ambrosiozyma monospora]|uniref:Unnamed protein product n=1 Tax=Ambrosiozyma monospora TaxID=43982 RepID=A0ACB5TB87_AMBMO|nr:unnamed protein product [Ambrosiozyma monospora]